MFKATTRLWESSVTYPQSHIPHEGSRCRFCHCEKPLGCDSECSLWRQGRCSHLFGRLRDIEIKVERSKSLQAWFLVWKQKWLSSAELTFPVGTGTKGFLPCFEIQVWQVCTRLASSQIFSFSGFVGNLSGFCFLLLIFPRTWVL